MLYCTYLLHVLYPGSPLYDMMIAMIIPLIFKMIFDGAGQMKPMLEKAGRLCRKPPQNQYLRVIEVEQKVTSWGWAMPPNGDDRNHVLIKAVNLYLADKQVSYNYAKVNLTSVSAGRIPYSGSDPGPKDQALQKLLHQGLPLVRVLLQESMASGVGGRTLAVFTGTPETTATTRATAGRTSGS